MAALNDARLKRFAREYLKTMDAERAAAAVGRDGQGPALLARKEVREEIERQREDMKKLCKRDDLIWRMWNLAFGRPNDCVRLALGEVDRLDELDLSLLAEVRRSDKGAVEVKLVDRMEVMDRLLELAGKEEDGATDFLQAIAGLGQAQE